MARKVAKTWPHCQAPLFPVRYRPCWNQPNCRGPGFGEVFPAKCTRCFSQARPAPCGCPLACGSLQDDPYLHGPFCGVRRAFRRQATIAIERREFSRGGPRPPRHGLSGGCYALPVLTIRVDRRIGAGQRVPETYGGFRIVDPQPSFSGRALFLEFWSVDVFCLRY